MIGAADYVTSRMLLRSFAAARAVTIALGVASVGVAIAFCIVHEETVAAREDAAQCELWHRELLAVAAFDEKAHSSELGNAVYTEQVAEHAEIADASVAAAFQRIDRVPHDALWALELDHDSTQLSGTWSGTLRVVDWSTIAKVATMMHVALAEPLPIDPANCNISSDGSMFEIAIGPLRDELRNKLESCREALSTPQAMLNPELDRLCLSNAVERRHCDLTQLVEATARVDVDRLGEDQRRSLYESTWNGSAADTAETLSMPDSDSPLSMLWLGWLLVALGFALCVTMIVAARRASGFFDHLPPGVEQSLWRWFPIVVALLAVGAGGMLPLALPTLRELSITTWQVAAGLLVFFLLVVAYAQRRTNLTIEELA